MRLRSSNSYLRHITCLSTNRFKRKAIRDARKQATLSVLLLFFTKLVNIYKYIRKKYINKNINYLRRSWFSFWTEPYCNIIKVDFFNETWTVFLFVFFSFSTNSPGTAKLYYRPTNFDYSAILSLLRTTGITPAGGIPFSEYNTLSCGNFRSGNSIMPPVQWTIGRIYNNRDWN